MALFQALIITTKGGVRTLAHSGKFSATKQEFKRIKNFMNPDGVDAVELWNCNEGLVADHDFLKQVRRTIAYTATHQEDLTKLEAQIAAMEEKIKVLECKTGTARQVREAQEDLSELQEALKPLIREADLIRDFIIQRPHLFIDQAV